MVEQLLNLDRYLFILINIQCSNSFFDFFFKTVTNPHFWIIPACMGSILFIVFEKKKALIIIGLALVTVIITDPVSSQLLKPLFGRFRPCHPDHFIQGANFLLGMKGSFSFPSSHSMNMFGQAMLFSRFYPTKAPIFWSFASIIGISRIYVGVHFPSDVFGGAILGILFADLIFVLYCEIFKKNYQPACSLPRKENCTIIN